jgi:hypothetical protein
VAEKSTEAPKETAPQEKKPPVQALFVRNVKSNDEARNLVVEEDRANIENVEHRGTAYIVHFKGHKEMTDAFARLPQELKERQSDPSKPAVAIYRELPPRGARGGGAAGNWGPRPVGPTGGYRSASDSEGGRGGMRGGRGGRGAPRGDRGDRGGRGRGGPRGGFGGPKTEGGASSGGDSKPAPSGGES